MIKEIGLGLVFLAGLVSFISPCVLSLIPVYVGLLAGSAKQDVISRNPRCKLLLRTLSFIGGFTLIFVLLGMSGTVIGGWLYPIKDWIARIGGLIIIIFGLHMTGLITLPFLNYEAKAGIKKAGEDSYWGAFLMGIAFSAGWSPCIGPILGAVLTGIVASQTDLAKGALYLTVYSAGMAVPFLLLSLGLGKGIELLRSHQKFVQGVQIAAGILLVIMGILLVMGITSKLNMLGWKINF